MAKAAGQRVKERSAGQLMLAGAASITLDQRIKMPVIRTTRQALATDLRALRSDYAVSVGRLGSKLERDR